jgi:hypothetical protein
MKLVEKNISLSELKLISENMYEKLVKAVVDVTKEIMIVDAPFHTDQKLFLLENGSEQAHLWGINLHPEKAPDASWIEFDSMINLRPSSGNRTRGIDNQEIKKQIYHVINNLVTYD